MARAMTTTLATAAAAAAAAATALAMAMAVAVGGGVRAQTAIDLGPGSCTTTQGNRYMNNVLFEDASNGCVYLCMNGGAKAFMDSQGVHRGCNSNAGGGTAAGGTAAGSNSMGGDGAPMDNLSTILIIAGSVGGCLLILIAVLVVALLFFRGNDDDDEDQDKMMMGENPGGAGGTLGQSQNYDNGGTWQQYNDGMGADMQMDGGAYNGGGEMMGPGGTEGFLQRPPMDGGMYPPGDQQMAGAYETNGGNMAVNAYQEGPEPPAAYNTNQFAQGGGGGMGMDMGMGGGGMSMEPGGQYSPHGMAAPPGAGGDMYLPSH